MTITETLTNLILGQSLDYDLYFALCLLGQEFILLLSFLSGQGLIPFWFIFVSSIVAVFIMDSLFFSFGKFPLIRGFFEKFHINFKRASVFLSEATGKSIFFTLFSAKFIYGTRFALIVYFGSKKMSYWYFLKRDLPATALWSVIMVPLAYLAGKGVLSSLGVVKNIQIIIALGIIFMIIMMFVGHKLASYILKKSPAAKKFGKIYKTF